MVAKKVGYDWEKYFFLRFRTLEKLKHDKPTFKSAQMYKASKEKTWRHEEILGELRSLAEFAFGKKCYSSIFIP